MSLDPPLVSVLTPSFNQARWLGENLSSVARQTYPRIEHIVMDGGSTDGSIDVLEREAGDRCVWRSGLDTGQSDAINKAYRASRGDVLGWLNSDDAYFRDDVVAAAVELFRRRPEVAVVYGHAVLVDAAGAVLHTMWVPPYRRRLLWFHDFIVQPATFIRRSALGADMVDESFEYMMDYELWLRLARSHAFARLPRIVAVDRHHRARKSFTRPDLAATDLRRLVAMYRIDDRANWRPIRKIMNVAIRLEGLGLVPSASPSPSANLHSPSWPALTARQVLVPRSRMRIDDASSRLPTPRDRWR
jgi:glycosyltransferase involved in cell wall biosynthesis